MEMETCIKSVLNHISSIKYLNHFYVLLLGLKLLPLGTK